MKKIAILAVLLAAALALGGCVKAHNAIVIEPDGSGTLKMDFSLSPTVAAAMKEMQELDPDATGEADLPDFEEMDRADIEKRLAPYDVKIKRFEKHDSEEKMGLDMELEFADLKGLSAAMTAVFEGEGNEGLGVFDAGDGNLVLKQATYDFSDMPPPPQEDEPEEESAAEAPSEPNPEDQQRMMEIMGTMMGAMSELDVRMEVTVPGEIVETNAPLQEGRTSIWTINAENMMTQGQDMNPVITFSGEGVKITPLTE